MQVHVESTLGCSAEAAWRKVKSCETLAQVSRPIVTFRVAGGDGFPPEWSEGSTVRCRTYLFGCVPLGTRKFGIERVDEESREIQTRECDPLIRRWDHLLRVTPEGDHECRYSDTIDIEAGVLTPLVWLFARLYFRHRHKRWREIAADISRKSNR